MLQRVEVHRAQGGHHRTVTVVSVEAIEADRTLEVELQDGDMIVVPFSMGW
jgi:hypothetical protein